MNKNSIQVTIVPRAEPDITLYVLALIEMAHAELEREQLAADGGTPESADPGDEA